MFHVINVGWKNIPKREREASGFSELLISLYFTFAGSGFCVFRVLIVATNVYKELVIYVLSTLKKKIKVVQAVPRYF